jgi:hypothetical protein
MIESVAELEGALGALLVGHAAGNLVNVLDVPGVRESVASSHHDMAADQLNHGESPADPYWDLTMADWSFEEAALFVLAMWRADGLSLVVGAAPRSEILDICDQFTMAEVEELGAAVGARFRLSESTIWIPRSLAEYWIAA